MKREQDGPKLTPYTEPLTFVKPTLHTHQTKSDGHDEPYVGPPLPPFLLLYCEDLAHFHDDDDMHMQKRKVAEARSHGSRVPALTPPHHIAHSFLANIHSFSRVQPTLKTTQQSYLLHLFV